MCSISFQKRELEAKGRGKRDYLHVLCAFVDVCGYNMERLVHYFSRSMTGGPSVCLSQSPWGVAVLFFFSVAELYLIFFGIIAHLVAY